MKFSQEELRELFSVCHSRPGWLSIMSLQLDLDPEDEAFLNDLADAELALAKQGRREISEWEAKAREAAREVDPVYVKECRLAYLKSELEGVRQHIRDIDDAYRKCVEDDIPPLIRVIWLASINDQKIRLYRDNLFREIRLLEGGGGMVEQEKLDRARKHPIENLIGGKQDKIICPLHDDTRPSLLIRNGFGYCFACNGVLDSIGYLKKVKGMKFREAVNALQ